MAAPTVGWVAPDDRKLGLAGSRRDASAGAGRAAARQPSRLDDDGVDFRRGADWEDPSPEDSRQHERQTKYSDGDNSLLTPLASIGHDLGEGIQLYFLTLRYLSMVMLVMTVLAVPSLLGNASGSKIPQEERDSMGLAVLTVGNHGAPPVFTDANATDATHASVTVGDRTYSAVAYGELIMAMDVLAVAAFLLALALLRIRIDHVSESVDALTTSASDYAVQVRGLPADATASEVRAHFDGLYPLDRPDWSFEGFKTMRIEAKAPRPPVERPIGGGYWQPTSDTTNTRSVLSAASPAAARGQGSHAGDVEAAADPSWVAEVSLAYRDYASIQRHKVLQRVRLAVVRARARVQMFAPGSRLADAAKMRKAEARLQTLDSRYAALAAAAGEAPSQEVCSAFVTFNCQASAERCIADYDEAGTSPCKYYWQAPPLRFRGTHRLIVTRAPEPSDILWENVETTWQQRAVRILATNAFVAVLLVASILVIYYSQLGKTKAMESLPTPRDCDVELPAVAYGTYDFPLGAALRRVPANDANCGAPLSGRWYLEWYDPSNPAAASPTARVDSFDAAAAAAAQEASNDFSLADDPATVAQVAAACTSHCVGPDSTTRCRSLEGSATSGGFLLRDVAGCYCIETMRDMALEVGLPAAIEHMRTHEADFCVDVVDALVLGNALFVVAAIGVVAVNSVLKVVLRRLVACERHVSVSTEAIALTVKISLALFLNTALVALLVNSALPNGRKLPVNVGLFEGRFSDMTPLWYASVGSAITFTVLLQAIAPHATQLASVYIVTPGKRWLQHRLGRVATQEHWDELYHAPHFELGMRFPNMLNLLAVTLLYCGAMPILLPIAALGFCVQYTVDWWLLLRVHARPPRYDSQLSRVSVKAMFIFLTHHLAMTAWAYGNSDTFASEPMDVFDSSGDAPEAAQRAYAAWKADIEANDELGLASRLVKKNVFPLALLCMVLVLVFILGHTLLRCMRDGARALFNCATFGRYREQSKITSLPCVPKSLATQADAGAKPGTAAHNMHKVRVAFTEEYRGYHPSYDESPPAVMARLCGSCGQRTRSLCCKGQGGGGDGEAAPRPLSPPPLSPDELADGWSLVVVPPEEDVDGCGYVYKVRRWLDYGQVDGVPHEPGQRMKCWEVVRAVTGAHSYAMANNAAYEAVATALEKSRHGASLSASPRVGGGARTRGEHEGGVEMAPVEEDRGGGSHGSRGRGGGASASVAPAGAAVAVVGADRG